MLKYDFFCAKVFYLKDPDLLEVFQFLILKLEQSHLLQFWPIDFAVSVLGHLESKWAIADENRLL